MLVMQGKGRPRRLRAGLGLLAVLAAIAVSGCETSSGPRVAARGPGSQGGGPSQGAVAPQVPRDATLVPNVERVQQGQSGAPAGQAALPRVALLLPLSGSNAGIGRALQEAAQLAVFDNADQSFVLITKDTRSSPAGAAAAAEAAVNEGARLIVGPLTAAETAAVAPRALPQGISILSLSNDRGVSQTGVWTFGHTPQEQMAALITHARSRGLSRFAVLVPNNPFGLAVADSVRAQGATIVANERYDSTPVEAVQRIGAVGGFDALVAPDLPAGLLVIGPLLGQNNISTERVRLLGSQFMETDARLNREVSLQGAWFAAPPADIRTEFERRYRGAYGRAPARLATLGYDAVALAAVLAKSPGGPDFSQAALTNPTGYAGMDGVFRLRGDGTVERSYAIYEVTPTGPRMIEPGRRSFADATR
jgi:branched-chain amino acid transport system substrate-binding protein